MNYWWVNANTDPDQWKIFTTPTDDDEAQKSISIVPEYIFSPKPTEWFSDYFSRANDPDAQEDDIVFCYKTGEVKRIVAIGRIRFVNRDNEGKVLGCYIEVIRKARPIISKADLNDIPGLNMQRYNNYTFDRGQRTMFRLESSEGIIILSLINNSILMEG